MSLIHLHNSTYYTSDQMIDGGHVACCECGAPHEKEVAHNKCYRCGQPFIFIRSKFIPESIHGNAQRSTNAPRHVKVRTVKRLVALLEDMLTQQGIVSLSICPQETYFKIYSLKGGGSNGTALNVTLD